MSQWVIRNARVLNPGEGVVGDALRVRDGRIVEVGPAIGDDPADEATFDGGGALLTPGLIDIQTHGIHTFAYEASAAQLSDGLAVLPQYGTTCVLPTLYSTLTREHLGDITELATALEQARDVRVPGFHLEGPFLAVSGAGALMRDGDVGFLDELVSACRGRVSAMSISPETPNVLAVIERLRARGIAAFITHTRATPEQTQAAIEAGARHATHFYDVFPVPEETEPGARPVGAVEVILGDRRCTVDFICDGVHVHPAAIRAAVAAKGYAGVMMCTDSNVGAGLPAGVYETPWGHAVRVAPGDGVRIDQPGGPKDGLLAGSALTMNVGIANLRRWLDLPEAQVWAMGTLNPARLLGLPGKGRIEAGVDADLVLWDDDLTPIRTWVGGRCVYSRDEA